MLSGKIYQKDPRYFMAILVFFAAVACLLFVVNVFNQLQVLVVVVFGYLWWRKIGRETAKSIEDADDRIIISPILGNASVLMKNEGLEVSEVFFRHGFATFTPPYFVLKTANTPEGIRIRRNALPIEVQQWFREKFKLPPLHSERGSII